ncbi:MAG: maleylpyruvate isomerase family mycothiol-dependent enzyme [bacterium]|nr:maleylpyruvate isomerase family mycothiol-dependent enzyme [bacterium]
MNEPERRGAAVEAIRRESQRQAELFHSWGDTEWALPTFCEGWTRRHAVAHLQAGSEFHEDVVRSGVQGYTGPPFGTKDVAAFRENRMAEMKRLMGLPVEALVAGFLERHAVFADLLEGLTPADAEKIAWHRIGLIPAGQFAGIRLYELGLHDWDIRAVDDQSLLIEPSISQAMTIHLPYAQWRFLNLVPASPPPAGLFRFRTEDGASWCLAIRDGRAEVAEGEDPDAEISGDATALMLQTTGRLAWRDALGQRRISITGDEKAEALLDALAVSY